MVPQHIIDEAKARGIVPGATCRSTYGTEWTVGPISNWDFENGNGLYDTTHTCNPFIHCQTDGWATVITPAPQAAPEGLVEGDACEPDDYLRAAIMAKAKELGFGLGQEIPQNVPLLWYGGKLCYTSGGPKCKTIRTMLRAGEFYDRLCKATKPIRIDGKEVKFNAGSIKVGCTTIDNATVRAIAANLKD